MRMTQYNNNIKAILKVMSVFFSDSLFNKCKQLTMTKYGKAKALYYPKGRSI